ncbi:HSF-type DNA-binding protein [Nitzschia inconspicua]|uniref:HSF-type DNA-binding protein n=1 Tax=Nitzschia inconspicua TaxID=303405 RepID=A0A9K3PBB3_9STRA|nr:HSF-type DNA-binding protein [Nitzschia inconspicua]
MLNEEEAKSKATAAAALLGVSKNTSSNGSGFAGSPQTSETITFDNTSVHTPYANWRHIQNDGNCRSNSSSYAAYQQKGSADTNHNDLNERLLFSSFLLQQQRERTAVSAFMPGKGEQRIHSTSFITDTNAHQESTSRPSSYKSTLPVGSNPGQSLLLNPQYLRNLPPLHTPASWENMTSQPQQPPSQPNNPNDNLHHARAMLSMTSIGFGIDSSPSASQGDATEAALRALHDAMERSSLRLPIASPAQNLLQIKVKLGVPAQPDNTSVPMSVDVERLSSFLPRVIPILPVEVTIGGLLLPSESLGAPAICTAVACITLQSQPAVASPILGAAPTQAIQAAPSDVMSSGSNSATAGTAQIVSTENRTQKSPKAPLHTASFRQTPKITIPPNPMQHLNNLATAAASSPPHPVSSSTSASSQVLVKESPQDPDKVHRSTSMEMLAMISEQIRNNVGLQQQQQRANAMLETAANIGSGLATAALLGKHQHQTITLEPIGGEAVAAALLQSHGRLKVPIDTTTNILSNGDASAASRSSSSTPVMGDEGDGDPRNPNSYYYKKLPPGVTTKKNQRLFVKHRYRDYSQEKPNPGEDEWEAPGTADDGKRPIRLVPAAFPTKLHETLQQIEDDGFGDIIGWMPHGRSFKIHKQKEFAEIVLPRYFIMTKKSSFLRQLNLYSFNRFSAGPDQGSYYHEKFLRGMKFLCRRMSRQKVNGNRIRSAGNPDEEPNLALFPVCPPQGLVAESVATANVVNTAHTRDNSAVLSALAGIAAVAAALPTKKRTAQTMTPETPEKAGTNEGPDVEDNDDEYGSSEENYSTGNTLPVNTR